MRLQLTLAACAAACAAAALSAGRAAAQTEFSSKVQVYVDDDHTVVISPLVRAQADVTPRTNVAASYVADVVTSASVDIVTQASKRTIHDTRHQGGLSVGQIFGHWTGRAGYLYSTENDYASHNVQASLERRLFDNDTTLSLGWSLALDRVGRANDPNFARHLTAQSLAFTVTQVLTRRLVAQLGYELISDQGYQASPYRFVPVEPTGGGDPLFWVAETDPDGRLRQAVVAGANLHILRDSAIQGDYRLYRDDWGILSHTLQARYLVNLSDRLELRVRTRLYTQGRASFYRARYDQVERYMTIDRELSPLRSALLGAKLSWRPRDDLEAELKVDAFAYSYPDFPRLTSRVGANVSLGLTLTY